MKCGNCRQEGHTKRTCTQPVANVKPSNAPKAAKKSSKKTVKVEKQNNVIVKPPLKWVGGKTQIIEQVLALFPRVMKN
jgi:hypothetical protein